MVILSLLSVNFKHHGIPFARRRVGPFTKSSIFYSKNDPDRSFSIVILSHFLRILQIYKATAELSHHALFRFTRFAVKNSDT